MIDNSFLTLAILNFLAITILPKIFFRGDGKFNLMWWITGAPFGIATFGVIVQKLGLVPQSLILSSQVEIAVVLAAVSVALISYTLGTHRIPISLWHQENDAPKSIVTWGAYSKIRHPFYCSFILQLLSCLAASTNPLTVLALVYGFLILNHTAAREERRLSASAYGDEYKAYIKKTGRFFPKLGSS